VADYLLTRCQHRDQGAITHPQIGVTVNVNRFDIKRMCLSYRLKMLPHVFTEVAAIAIVKREGLLTHRELLVRHLQGDETRTVPTIDQDCHRRTFG